MDLPKPYSQTHVAIGNVNLDVSLRIPRLPGPEENVRASDFWIGLGGAATNYAIAVARLQQRSVLVARAGREARLLGLLEALKREGVNVEYVSVVDEPIGVVVVLIDQSMSRRSMITMRGANERLSAADIPRLKAEVAHFASVKPAVVVDAVRMGKVDDCAMVSYDPGGEAFQDPLGVLDAARHVDFLMVNDKELEAIAGSSTAESASRLLSGRLRGVLVKLGEMGAALVTRDGVVGVKARRPRGVVDVTGAGDAFNAAFNIWYTATGDIKSALQVAVAAGTAKTLRRGSSSMPSWEEILGSLRLLDAS